MLGLYSRCQVKAVYAAHAVAVELLLPDGRPTRDWLVVALQVIAPLAERSVAVDDLPPFLPKRYQDPDWDTDSPIVQLGPCPKARAAVCKLLANSSSLAVHIPQTESWFENLTLGSVLRGDLIIDDQSLTERIINARIAKAAD